MARAHFADVLIGTSGTGALSLLDGATVHVYDQGTTNHIAQTLYAADSGGTTIANPFTSDANGKVEFWLDTPARVDLAASKTGFSPSTRTVDVEDVPIAVSGTPVVGDTLVFDGTKYVPQAPSLRVATVEISSAEVLALHTTPKVLVAEPADVERMIAPALVAVRYNPGTTPYTQAGGAGGVLQFEQDAGNGWFNGQLDDVLAGGDLARRWAVFQSGGTTFMGTVYRGLRARATSALIGGDGTLTITVAYLVV